MYVLFACRRARELAHSSAGRGLLVLSVGGYPYDSRERDNAAADAFDRRPPNLSAVPCLAKHDQHREF